MKFDSSDKIQSVVSAELEESSQLEALQAVESSKSIHDLIDNINQDRVNKIEGEIELKNQGFNDFQQ